MPDFKLPTFGAVDMLLGEEVRLRAETSEGLSFDLSETEGRDFSGSGSGSWEMSDSRQICWRTAEDLRLLD